MENDKGRTLLWAPWRMEYILGEKTGECFLCKLAQENPSEENLLLARTAGALVVFNRYPYNNGHLLVAPHAHTSDPGNLDPATWTDLMEVFRFSLGVLRQALAPEGFNAGLNLGKSAGAGLAEHMHWHIVPRWNGDTNFMPVTAGGRVIPEALASSWRKLAPLFAELPGVIP